MRERNKHINEKRKEYAIIQLDKLKVEYTYEDDVEIRFLWKGNEIKLFPFTGWFSGKGIKDGRGINNLLKQLKP